MRRLLLLITVLALAGCGAPTPPPTQPPAEAPATAANPTAPAAYPGPAAAAAYPGPAAAQNASPVPTTPFTISEPVRASDTSVSGTGPGLVPVRLVDLSDNGAFLAEMVIPGDGNFTMQLIAPLNAGHRIGLVLGNPGTPGIPPFDPNFYTSGRGYEEVSGVGFILDSTTIE